MLLQGSLGNVTERGKVLNYLAGVKERAGRCLGQRERRGGPGLLTGSLWPLTLIRLVLDRALRKNFIISKYVEKKYAKRSPAAQCSILPEAIKDKDIFSLLQAYAHNVDLSEPVLAPLQVRLPVLWACMANSFAVPCPACP